MTNCQRAVAVELARRIGRTVALAGALLAVAACGGGGGTGKVTGTVKVDGQVPAEGSSITFFPNDGKSPSSGGLIDKGKYSATVAVGKAKVEIRVPRSARSGKAKVEGPGGPGGDIIEESLPAKFNDKSELTFEVKSGSQEKNWELSTKDN